MLTSGIELCNRTILTIRSFQIQILQEEPLIPHFLFEEQRRTAIKLIYCERNEKKAQVFLRKLNCFTQHRYKIEIIWQTRKIKSLFGVKDKNCHKSHAVYEGQCNRGVKYIGEGI